MSAITLETYLAMLYTDAALRAKFLREPHAEALKAGLSLADAWALANIDVAGLRMAANSYAHKRAGHQRPRRKFIDLFSNWWASRPTTKT